MTWGLTPLGDMGPDPFGDMGSDPFGDMGPDPFGDMGPDPFVRISYGLRPSSQNATALAAATLSESTPWYIGILTV